MFLLIFISSFIVLLFYVWDAHIPRKATFCTNGATIASSRTQLLYASRETSSENLSHQFVMLARHSNQIYHYWLVDKCQILWIYSFLSAIYCEYILYTIILYLKCMWPVLLIQCEIQFLLLLSFYAVESSSMMQYTLCSNIIYPNFHPSFLQTKITQITPLSVLFNMYNFIHFISFHYQSRLNSNTLCNVTH